MNDELFTRFGESKEHVVADRKLIEDLFDNLYKNRIIYNERITILSEIVDIQINDGDYEFTHRPIRLLEILPTCEDWYDRWVGRGVLSCGGNLDIPDMPHVYTHGRLSTAYAGYRIWPGFKRVEHVSNMSDDELRTHFGHIMWDRPILS